MTTPRLDVDPFVLAVMAESHDVPIRRGRGRRWITITNPVTGSVVRVVATRPDVRETARRQTAEFMATLPTQRVGEES